MVILQLRERLGNQLFQYAFARRIMEETGDAHLIINQEEYIHRNRFSEGWRVQLDEFNTIPYEIIDGFGIVHNKKTSLLRVVLNVFRKIIYKIPENKRHSFEVQCSFILQKFGVYWLKDGYMKINKPLPFIRDKYIFGYFEDPAYFELVDEEIKKELTPKQQSSKENEELYHKICSTESICVTVRRGDFLSNEFKDRLFVCDEPYFQKGVDYIRKQYPDASVFVFSDDMEWARSNLDYGNTYYETGNDTVSEKLRLMSACKHFVISNSTFSWWAQHLSMNLNKIVVAPSRWRNDELEVRLYERNWTILSMEETDE